ncbi:MAG TPA: HmuY family protein, partial [Bacteroidia bacterium]|nr:HmuY family protein [Bacteroidia bacterium]
MKKLEWFWRICLCCCLMACDRKELPIPVHSPGELETGLVHLGGDYRWQAYFDLETGNVVGQNLKTEWDLGFETQADGFHVVLNGAKAMYAWASGDSNLATFTDTTGFAAGKRWDAPSGNWDSTAIGDWRGQNEVYVVDRGYDEQGRHQGFRKLKVLQVNSTEFQIAYGELNGSIDTLGIPKDSSYNLSF